MIEINRHTKKNEKKIYSVKSLTTIQKILCTPLH